MTTKCKYLNNETDKCENKLNLLYGVKPACGYDVDFDFDKCPKYEPTLPDCESNITPASIEYNDFLPNRQRALDELYENLFKFTNGHDLSTTSIKNIVNLTQAIKNISESQE
jgi:hypothetical protein